MLMYLVFGSYKIILAPYHLSASCWLSYVGKTSADRVAARAILVCLPCLEGKLEEKPPICK